MATSLCVAPRASPVLSADDVKTGRLVPRRQGAALCQPPCSSGLTCAGAALIRPRLSPSHTLADLGCTAHDAAGRCLAARQGKQH
jgi:hypothetical protein